MSTQNLGFPVTYKGANVSFVKRMNRQTQKDVYCSCVQSYYKKFSTAENNPNISNAMRVSQILSASSNLGGKTYFGNSASNKKTKYDYYLYSALQLPTIRPIRNKF